MTLNELIDFCVKQSAEKGYIIFPEEVIKSLNSDQARALVDKFGTNSFMMLPQFEIDFFEWLKVNDKKIWEDLWGGTDEMPYLTGLAMLPRMLDKTRGFPICDLVDNDNFYFAPIHILQDQARLLLESIKERFLKNDDVSTAHILLMEISMSPIDIWHFAYHFKKDLEEVKNAVAELVEDELIVHITDAEHLASYVEF